MPYPPATLAANKTNQTAEVDDHPTHHNDLATAINDIVTELEARREVFTQATAPTATAGDIWVDTSATPARIYRKT